MVPFRVSRVIFMYRVNAIVYFSILIKNLYALLHLIMFKTHNWYQSDIWLQGDAFVVEALARFLSL